MDGRFGVELTVSDNGPGIASDIKARVFDPFFSTKPAGQGTGLGLFLSREVVVAHGGQLTLESEVGTGTTATVILPGLPTIPDAA